MKSLWNMLNKEFTIEGAVSAFLVINIIAWMLITMGVGMLVCKFLGFSIGGNMTNLMCAGIYGGLIVGLIGTLSTSESSSPLANSHSFLPWLFKCSSKISGSVFARSPIV